jgi:hypothetical protein
MSEVRSPPGFFSFALTGPGRVRVWPQVWSPECISVKGDIIIIEGISVLDHDPRTTRVTCNMKASMRMNITRKQQEKKQKTKRREKEKGKRKKQKRCLSHAIELRAPNPIPLDPSPQALLATCHMKVSRRITITRKEQKKNQKMKRDRKGEKEKGKTDD